MLCNVYVYTLGLRKKVYVQRRNIFISIVFIKARLDWTFNVPERKTLLLWNGLLKLIGCIMWGVCVTSISTNRCWLKSIRRFVCGDSCSFIVRSSQFQSTLCSPIISLYPTLTLNKCEHAGAVITAICRRY